MMMRPQWASDLQEFMQTTLVDIAADIGALGLAVFGVTVAWVAIRWATRLFKGA